jgi:hypothetical protein
MFRLDVDSFDVERVFTRLCTAIPLVIATSLLLGFSRRDSRFEQARCAIELNTALSRIARGMRCCITVF